MDPTGRSHSWADIGRAHLSKRTTESRPMKTTPWRVIRTRKLGGAFWVYERWRGRVPRHEARRAEWAVERFCVETRGAHLREEDGTTLSIHLCV